MKYYVMPAGIWTVFCKTFRRNLVSILGFKSEEAKTITRKSRSDYRSLIHRMPEFEKGDFLKINTISCAMLSCFICNMPKRPSVEKVTEFYHKSMMIGPMYLYCRLKGMKKYSRRDFKAMKKAQERRAYDRNPYSWNMTFLPFEDGSGYVTRFTDCGICTLMRELGVFEYVSALCTLDFPMEEATKVTDFSREITMPEGAPYCDCVYRRK